MLRINGIQKLWLPILTIWCLLILCVPSATIGDPQCFQVQPETCKTNLTTTLKCNITSSDSSTYQIFCCNVTQEKEIEESLNSLKLPESKKLSGFHLRDSNLTSLNVDFFNKLKELASVSFTNNRIDRWSGRFDEYHSFLTCLNISENTVVDMFPYLLNNLRGLKKIAITNNTNLTDLPTLPRTRTVVELDLSGNKNLLCIHLINLTHDIFVGKQQVKQVNKNGTICLPPSLVGNNKKGQYVTMNHIDKVREIYRGCPTVLNANITENCTCEAWTLDINEKNELQYQALVDCSHRNLTSLPSILPLYTRILNVTHNHISSLDGIRSNSVYNDILELLADFNDITSLKPLEGSGFLDNFQLISVKYNKIHELSEIHALSHMFDRFRERTICLGHNVLKCECHTAAVTKRWLANYQYNIPDSEDVLTECDGITMKVLEMKNQKELCKSKTELKDYYRYVIIAEVTLLVLMIGKVSYDYYVFKTAGYLPWPASKMPKLPCDWCFET